MRDAGRTCSWNCIQFACAGKRVSLSNSSVVKGGGWGEPPNKLKTSKEKHVTVYQKKISVRTQKRVLGKAR